VQAARTARQSALGEAAPLIALLAIGLLIAVSSVMFGPLAVMPIFGVLFFVVVMARPEYGIALFLSTFLMSYPAVLRGAGYLTINNVLGGIFTILLTYKIYREGDWWFARRPEIVLLGFITLTFYLSGRFNGPDPQRLSLLGSTAAFPADNLRTFANRVAFTVFFINFIRRPTHVRMIYVLALALMIYTGLTGVQNVLGGAGFKGFRAAVGAAGGVGRQAGVITAAANPNRLAMFAILGIVGLWYLMQSLRTRVVATLAIPIIGLLALAVFMTASRSGLLGLGVATTMIAVSERITLRGTLSLVLAFLLVMVLVVQLVPQKNLERITNLPGTESGETGEGSGSLQRRGYTWEIAFELFRESPFLGVGVGNWAVVRFLTDPARATGAPHSSYLLALVEGGLFCLCGFLGLLWRTWRNFRFAERYVSDPQSPLADLAWIVRAGKTSLAVLVFFSVFADLWQLVILFWLVGLSIVVQRLVEQTRLRNVPAY
jgi:O-antigen ligase